MRKLVVWPPFTCLLFSFTTANWLKRPDPGVARSLEFLIDKVFWLAVFSEFLANQGLWIDAKKSSFVKPGYQVRYEICPKFLSFKLTIKKCLGGVRHSTFVHLSHPYLLNRTRPGGSHFETEFRVLYTTKVQNQLERFKNGPFHMFYFEICTQMQK